MPLFKEVKKPVIRATSAAGAEISPLRPRYSEKQPPCISHCPNEADIRGWITKIAQAEAYGLTNAQALEQVEIQAKYSGYIDRQQAEIERTRRYDHWRLPEAFDYSNVVGLSNEVREKLIRQKPETLGQAGRIPGVTPAAISLLLVHLKKKSA